MRVGKMAKYLKNKLNSLSLESLAVLPPSLFAQAYGEGAYGSALYGGESGLGTLPNTGVGWGLLIGLVLMITAGIVIYISERKKTAKNTS